MKKLVINEEGAMAITMAVMIALCVAVGIACHADEPKYNKELGYSTITARGFERLKEKSKEKFQSLEGCELWLLCEANRAVTEYTRTKMTINDSCIVCYYETGVGTVFEYSWKSGDTYYWSEFTANYTEGSYPTLVVVDGCRLIETSTTYLAPG